MTDINRRDSAHLSKCEAKDFKTDEQLYVCGQFVDMCLTQDEKVKKGAQKKLELTYYMSGKKNTPSFPSYDRCSALLKTLVAMKATPDGTKPDPAKVQDYIAERKDMLLRHKKATEEQKLADAKRSAEAGRRLWDKSLALVTLAESASSYVDGIKPRKLREIYNQYLQRNVGVDSTSLESSQAYYMLADDAMSAMLETESGYMTVKVKGHEIGCQYLEKSEDKRCSYGPDVYDDVIKISCDWGYSHEITMKKGECSSPRTTPETKSLTLEIGSSDTKSWRCLKPSGAPIEPRGKPKSSADFNK